MSRLAPLGLGGVLAMTIAVTLPVSPVGCRAAQTLPPAAEAKRPLPAPVAAPWAVSPHAAAVRDVFVDPTGSAAVSMDRDGAVRLWPTLDGKTGPLPLVEHETGPWLGADLVATGQRSFRVLLRSAAQTMLLDIDADGRVVISSRLPGSPLAVLLGHDAVLAAVGATITLTRGDGTQSTATLPDPIVHLRPMGAGDAVVAITGALRETDIEVLWTEGGKLEVFDGAATRIAADERGLVIESSPVPFESADEVDGMHPAIAADGRMIATRSWKSFGDATHDGEITAQVEVIDLHTGRRHVIDEEPGSWMAFSPASTVEWKGRQGVRRTIDDTHFVRRAVLRNGTAVAPHGRWLHVMRNHTVRWIGAPMLNAQAVAFSPDGQTLAWASNYIRGRPPQLQLSGVNNDGGPVGTARPLTGVASVAALAWVHPETLVIVEREGGVFVVDAADGSPSRAGAVDEELVGIEHDPVAGVSLLRIAYGGVAVMQWRGDTPTAPERPPVLGDEDWRVGLVRGEQPGLWILSDDGLATVPLDALRMDPATLDFKPLSGDPREVFGVAWSQTGDRFVDWGDRVIMTGRRAGSWPRDAGVFGTLLPLPDDAGLLTLPGCDRGPPQIAVAPRATGHTDAGATWVHDIPRYSMVALSPRGKYLAIASGDAGGSVLDLTTHEVVRHFRSGPFEVREQEPPIPEVQTGECLTLEMVQDGEEPYWD